QQALAEISGMDAVTLQPAAGAHGELTAVVMMRAYHAARGRPRKKILMPDAAHGTNPATVALAGFQVVALKSNAEGLVDVGELEAALDEDVAGFMVTNPNTLGKFERRIGEIAARVHEAGGLMYMDGANLNALMGIARPGDMGFDVMHFNLHKTFTTLHGGGGPGAWPVCEKGEKVAFLQVTMIVRDEDGRYRREWDRPESFGMVPGFMGNFAMHVRALSYIRMLDASGVGEMEEVAILNYAYV